MPVPHQNPSACEIKDLRTVPPLEIAEEERRHGSEGAHRSGQSARARTGSSRGAPGARPHRHEPRLGPRRGQGTLRTRIGAQPELRRHETLERLAPRASGARLRARSRRASSGRGTRSLDLKIKTQIGYVQYFLRDFDRVLREHWQRSAANQWNLTLVAVKVTPGKAGGLFIGAPRRGCS